MDKEEYYKRIEKINNRFRTDRVSADEEYQLVCQRNYLSTKYIEYLEQQCKKQKEVIDKIKDLLIIKKSRCLNEDDYILNVLDLDEILDVLNEALECNK